MTSEHDKRTSGGGLDDEAVALAHAADRLSARFPEVPKEDIDRLVGEHYDRFDGAPVRDFVPVLVEHEVKVELKEESDSAD